MSNTTMTDTSARADAFARALTSAGVSAQDFKTALASLNGVLGDTARGLSTLAAAQKSGDTAMQAEESAHENRMAQTRQTSYQKQRQDLTAQCRTTEDTLTGSLDRQERTTDTSLERMRVLWRAFGQNITNFWTSFWQDLAAGAGFQQILKNFLSMLSQMAIQLGTMIMLAAVALSTVPIFGQLSAGAGLAAGAALTAFGGLLQGLASRVGSSGKGSAATGSALGGSGSSSGGWAGVSPSVDTGGRTIVINIEAGGSLDTADTIAARVTRALRLGESLGY